MKHKMAGDEMEIVNKMFRKIMKVGSKGKIIFMQMNYREEI